MVLTLSPPPTLMNHMLLKVKHAIVITGKNYGFVTFSSPASVEQLLEMRESLEVAGSKVILRQVMIFSNLVIKSSLSIY